MWLIALRILPSSCFVFCCAAADPAPNASRGLITHSLQPFSGDQNSTGPLRSSAHIETGITSVSWHLGPLHMNEFHWSKNKVISVQNDACVQETLLIERTYTHQNEYSPYPVFLCHALQPYHRCEQQIIQHLGIGLSSPSATLSKSVPSWWKTTSGSSRTSNSWNPKLSLEPLESCISRCVSNLGYPLGKKAVYSKWGMLDGFQSISRTFQDILTRASQSCAKVVVIVHAWERRLDHLPL